MTDHAQLDLLLNRIEENCDPAIGSTACISFMLDCLALVERKLPQSAADALELCRQYSLGRANIDSIREMRVKCWRSADEHSTPAGVDLDANAIRAVLFLLGAQERPDERDIVDSFSQFLALVNSVQPHFEEEETLLRKHFAECLVG